MNKELERAPKMVTNISESALGKVMQTRLPEVIQHTNEYAMRVYPKGLRVFSCVPIHSVGAYLPFAG